jgi:mannitol/fructose-specific phosphotransferase system IIA component (Ntr-type)
MIIDLQANERWQVIDELIDSLVAAGKIIPKNRDAISAAVKKREVAMSTGIGFGIGIPHASSNLIPEVIYALGRSRQGVNFNSLDGQPVHLVWLFLVPEGQIQKHLHTLANIAKLLHQPDIRAALDRVQSETELQDLLRPVMLGNAPFSPSMLPTNKLNPPCNPPSRRCCRRPMFPPCWCGPAPIPNLAIIKPTP